MFAALAVLLLAAHWTADYPGQTDHQASHKACTSRRAACLDEEHLNCTTGSSWRANGVHAGTHVLACAVALGIGVLVLEDVVLRPLPVLLALAWIGATHAVIDRRWPVRWWMETTGQREFIQHGGMAHVDQSFHVLALVIAALFLTAAS